MSKGRVTPARTVAAEEEEHERRGARQKRMPARCLAGARVYVATAVYGAEQAQWNQFRRVLRNVHALRSFAANVTLAIAVTDAPPAAVVSEPGWRLATTVLPPPPHRLRRLATPAARSSVRPSLSALRVLF